MERHIKGHPVVRGAVEARAIVSKKPLSFWGGLSPETGQVIDVRHDRTGDSVAGKVFVFPTGKGSSTASAILLEAARRGNAPAAIVNRSLDPILALGAILVEQMYQIQIPVIIVNAMDLLAISDGDLVRIDEDGAITIHKTP